MGERAGDNVLSLDISPRRVIKIGDTWYRDFEASLSPEWIDQIATGYRCLNCFEPLQAVGAYPKLCPLCGYEVAKCQQQDFEREYQGEDKLGSSDSIDAQYATARELNKEKEARERAAKVGLVVPAWKGNHGKS